MGRADVHQALNIMMWLKASSNLTAGQINPGTVIGDAKTCDRLDIPWVLRPDPSAKHVDDARETSWRALGKLVPNGLT
jgi:hypothetical protein